MKTLLTATFLLVALSLFAQGDFNEKGFSRHKFYSGGFAGFSFDSHTLLTLAPQIGYRFNRYFSSGIGINLEYVNVKDEYNGEIFRRTYQGVIGFNVFGRAYPIQNIFFHVQPEINYIFGKQIFYQPVRESWKLDDLAIPSILIGGGLSFPIRNSAISVMALYDVWQDGNSPYGKKALFTVGYNFGL